MTNFRGLTALSVSPGTLTPTFSYSQTSYTIPDIGYGTHLATIDATPESGAEVSFLDSTDNDYDDLDDEAEGQQVYARVGSTTIKIKVEEDGTEQVYTLVFTRAKPTVSIQRVTSEPATEGDTLSFEVSRATVAGDVLDVRVGVDEVDIVEGEGHGNILPDHIEGTSPLYIIEEDESSLGLYGRHSGGQRLGKALQDRDEHQVRVLVRHRQQQGLGGHCGAGR